MIIKEINRLDHLLKKKLFIYRQSSREDDYKIVKKFLKILMKLRPSINNDMIENKKLNINFCSMNATVVELIINFPDLCR